MATPILITIALHQADGIPLLFVVPPADVPLVADELDGEPSWEDAEWQ